MGKILKGLAMAVGFVALAFVTGGASILATGATAAAGSVTIAGVTFAAGLGSALFGMAAASLLSGISQQLFSPKIPETQLSRLNITINPTASRKVVFGTTALNSDLAYHEISGTNQEYVDYIILCAAHKVTAISQIWFDDKKAWDSSTGVTATYSGYLTVNTRTEGTSGNTIAINGGSKWGSSRRLTGCAYVYLRIKRSGNDKRAESPLVSGLPSRITIRGNGALLYDPRKDSTVTGGSGSHRTNDQTTWGVYTDADDCDNPALQLLWWLLGWKINGVLSVGCGVPAERIDLESFITAANVCDENITLAGGGTQKRYRTSGTASDSDDRRDIINSLLACMNGTLRDNEGKLTVTAIKNDLANYTLSFDDDDILGEFEWNQTRGLTETYNVARGRYVDPSDNSLYQMIDYPEVRITSVDGIERVATVDLPYVEDGKRAQRIAKQVLQRNQYRGMFTATFTAKAMGCQVGDVVRLTFGPLGWTNKLFRVVSQQIDFTGRVPMALVEENAAIYAWDAEEQAVVTPTAPTVYNPLNSPYVLAISDAEQAFSFTQDSPTPSAKFIGQTWYKPTSKEWYYSTGTGVGNWQRILGDMSLLNENTRVAIVSGFKYFNSNDYSDNGSSVISIVTDYTFTPYWADSKIQITVFGYITDVDSDDSTSTMYGRIYINGSAMGAEQTVAYGNSGEIRNYSFNVPQTNYSGSTLVQARFKRTGTATSFPGCQAALMIEEFLQ